MQLLGGNSHRLQSCRVQALAAAAAVAALVLRGFSEAAFLASGPVANRSAPGLTPDPRTASAASAGRAWRRPLLLGLPGLPSSRLTLRSGGEDVRGGLRLAQAQRSEDTTLPDGREPKVDPPRNRAVQAWGTLGVAFYLSYGVARVVPIVVEGMSAISTWWQWALLAVTLAFFAYVEGYKGFQKGFSPRVVSRAWVVAEESSGAPFWHKVLAPAFCIGYFHGTSKRVITSWAVTTVIFAVVVGVKQLPNPYRAIIDAGVIVGLMWGIISIIVLYVQSLQNQKPPEYDPCLPEDTPYTRTERA